MLGVAIRKTEKVEGNPLLLEVISVRFTQSMSSVKCSGQLSFKTSEHNWLTTDA